MRPIFKGRFGRFVLTPLVVVVLPFAWVVATLWEGRSDLVRELRYATRYISKGTE